MNPIVCDEGIVLRIDPQSNTSLRSAWLLRRQGHAAMLLKGAQRPKSFLLGQLDLFYTCEVVFYRHTRGQAHMVRECYPLATRSGLRAHWSACAAASWICALVSQTLPIGGHAAPAYPRLVAALDALAAGADPRAVQHWFELHWLAVLGLAPRLNRCAACGGPPPAPTGGGMAFSATRGGVLCSACRRGGEEAGTVFVLTADTHARLRAWQRTAAPGPDHFPPRSPRQAAEAEGLLGAFLQHHADIDLSGREALRAWLAGT